MGESSSISERVSSPPCASNPQAWDMDQGGLTDWLRSLRICTTECPLLTRCWEARNRQYADGRGPVGVIWAGTAYTETGQPLLTQSALVEYGSAGNSRRRRQAGKVAA